MSETLRRSLDHCTAAQLKALLSLAAEPGRAVASLPRIAARFDELLSQLSARHGFSSGELVDTICDPDSSVAALDATKEEAKRLRAKENSADLRDAATVIYHAAIAAAFARSGTNLSRRAIEQRFGLYEDLASAFAGRRLERIFRAAVDQMSLDEGLVL